MSMRDDDFSDPTDLEAEGMPAVEDPPPGLEDAYNQVEGIFPPRDRPLGADEWGTTAEEVRSQEPLADRVLREEPEAFGSGADDGQVGRLVELDQGVAGRDWERDPLATEVDDTDGMSAEEAAMHITDNP